MSNVVHILYSNFSKFTENDLLIAEVCVQASIRQCFTKSSVINFAGELKVQLVFLYFVLLTAM